MIELIFSIDDYYHVSKCNEQLYDIDENRLLLHLFHFLLMARRRYLCDSCFFYDDILPVEQYVVMELGEVRLEDINHSRLNMEKVLLNEEFLSESMSKHNFAHSLNNQKVKLKNSLVIGFHTLFII